MATEPAWAVHLWELGARVEEKNALYSLASLARAPVVFRQRDVLPAAPMLAASLYQRAAQLGHPYAKVPPQ